MYDIDAIKEDFSKVVEYSQGFSPRLDELFSRWEEAKKPFINKFGGLIYEIKEPISFRLDEKEKKIKVQDFIDSLYMTYDREELANFVSKNQDTFFENKVSVEWEIDGVKIPKGMKLVKAFKFFESNPRLLETLQMAASRIIQEDKITGTLCLSVHPLDFLSVSENNYNWRSCHALDGEYRGGNLSYMVDKTTIVCYLKGEDNVRIPMFHEDVLWNSKKWRMLLYLNEDQNCLFAGRQYPFSSIDGLNQVSKYFLEKMDLKKDDIWGWDTWSEWNDDCVNSVGNINLDFCYYPFNGRLYVLGDIVKNNSGSLQFNDLLSSSCYSPMYKYKSGYWKKDPVFYIGGAVTCLCCERKKITHTSSFMCNDCECEYGDEENDFYAYCDCCGSRFERDYGCWTSDDSFVCSSCANEEYRQCACCGELVSKDNIKYDDNTGEYICSWCYFRKYEEPKILNNPFSSDREPADVNTFPPTAEPPWEDGEELIPLTEEEEENLKELWSRNYNIPVTMTATTTPENTVNIQVEINRGNDLSDITRNIVREVEQWHEETLRRSL